MSKVSERDREIALDIVYSDACEDASNCNPKEMCRGCHNLCNYIANALARAREDERERWKSELESIHKICRSCDFESAVTQVIQRIESLRKEPT